MRVHHIGWHRQGSADEVIIIVDVPYHESLSPDYFFEHECLMLYGRRTGKLRSKLIPYFDVFGLRINRGRNREYAICKPDLNQVKFKHLIPQVEQHLAWTILKI